MLKHPMKMKLNERYVTPKSSRDEMSNLIFLGKWPKHYCYVKVAYSFFKVYEIHILVSELMKLNIKDFLQV